MGGGGRLGSFLLFPASSQFPLSCFSPFVLASCCLPGAAFRVWFSVTGLLLWPARICASSSCHSEVRHHPPPAPYLRGTSHVRVSAHSGPTACPPKSVSRVSLLNPMIPGRCRAQRFPSCASVVPAVRQEGFFIYQTHLLEARPHFHILCFSSHDSPGRRVPSLSLFYQ